MEQEIYQIYDKIFKKILTLSGKAVINLINGLFDTDYPIDSTIRYNWTEFVDDELRRILADTIVTVNEEHSYHMEAQMTEDENIVFRVFDYEYAHANRYRVMGEEECELNFPEPKVIYLYSGKAPDEFRLKLNFGTQGSFTYRIPTFKFLECTAEELNRKKMVILIPFALLKLRKIMEKERSAANLESLKKLIQDDILGNINRNLETGNITVDDARKLKRQTQMLYEHIYAHYEEMKELNEMTDESLMLDIDVIEKEQEKREQEFLRQLEEKDEEIKSKDEEIKNKDKEIEKLKYRIEALTSK